MPSLIEANSLDAVPSITNDVENINGTVNGTATEKPKSPSSNKSSGEEENLCNPDDNFEVVAGEEADVSCTFSNLIERMRDFQYENLDEVNLVNIKCRLLFQRDYKLECVINDVCINYPKEILVPVSKKEDEETNLIGFNAGFYTGLVNDCKVARLRRRFVAPVILFDNKFICRSGTLCVPASAVFENVKGSMPSSVIDIPGALLSPMRIWNAATATYESVQLILSDALQKQYAKDVELLQYLKVDRICDLMVEYNKHFKDLVNVSSTEKANEEIYKGMKGEEMPYPGCEFFTEYFEAERNPKGLVFNWNQSDVKRTLSLTLEPKLVFQDMDIENFKVWDLVSLTQNYLKIILSYLVSGTGGILVHCISGWDRTPLFVSLIRLSLWADGVIHTSLDYEDMAYLTVAYDWYLFGHNLPDRLKKKEEVMHFCFNFLEHITSDEFSTTRMFKELHPEIKMHRTFPEFVPERRKNLNKIRDYVMKWYNAHIPKPENERSWFQTVRDFLPF